MILRRLVFAITIAATTATTLQLLGSVVVMVEAFSIRLAATKQKQTMCCNSSTSRTNRVAKMVFFEPTPRPRRILLGLSSSSSLSSNNNNNNNDDSILPQDMDTDTTTTTIAIEYCPGCRWGTKAFWITTELFSRYNNNHNNHHNHKLKGVTVIPAGSGTFRVTATTTNSATTQILWDRTVDRGFPPMDLVSFFERVDDCLLAAAAAAAGSSGWKHADNDPTSNNNDDDDDEQTNTNHNNHRLVIRFGPPDLFRAVYYGQEALTTFGENELSAVVLEPSTKGFSVSIDSEVLCVHDDESSSNKYEYPQPKTLKQRIRDVLAPNKDLGHSDNNKPKEEEKKVDDLGDCIPCNEDDKIDSSSSSDIANALEEEDDDGDGGFMDDDEAEEARRYFGVM